MRAIFIIYSPAVAGQDKTQMFSCPTQPVRENLLLSYIVAEILKGIEFRTLER